MLPLADMSLKMKTTYVVALEPGVWLAPWEGDPGRTLVLENAKRYPSERSAKRALQKARRLTGRYFSDASIAAVVKETAPEF